MLEALGFGVKFDEHLARLHVLAHHQACHDDPTGNGCLDRMGGPVHLQTRRLGHFIDGHPGREEPGGPATQERCRQQ
jgi:hypothetical protein